MQAVFYTISKRRNSTKRPASGTTYDVVIKESSGVVRPRIMLKWSGTGSPAAFNMAYISAFGRYYWVDEWTYADRCWTASLHTDVLATAKTEIGAASKYVLRAASDYNTNVPDRKYMPIFPCRTQNHTVTGIAWASTFDNGRFVVGIVGQGNTFNAGGTGYVVLTGTQLQTIYNKCFTETTNTWVNATVPATVEEALNQFGENFFKSVQVPSQFISSICWVPFIPTTTGTTTVMLGNINTGVAGGALSDPLYTDTFSVNIPWNDNGDDAYMYAAPYAQYRLHIPPFPDLELDGAKLFNKTLTGYIRTDVTSGLAHLEVGTSGTTFASLGANLGITISLAGNTVDYFGAVKGTAQGVGNVVGNVLSGNIAGAITGGVAAVGDVYEAMQPKATQGGYSGGLGAIKANKVLTRTLYTVPDRDNTEFGRPLCKIKTINTLAGFIICGDGEIAAPLTDGELAEIEAYLTGGFFYE